MHPLVFLVEFAVVVLVALCGTARGNDARTTTNQFPVDNGGTVTVKAYKFPGAIQSYWWVSEQDVVVMAHGHLFLSRNYASDGVWVSLTEAIETFASNNSRVPGSGQVTGIRYPQTPSGKRQDILIVETLSESTYVLSIVGPDPPMIVGKVELQSVPLSGPFDQFPRSTLSLGMSAVFVDVQFHPTIPSAALALLKDPNCRSLQPLACKSYVYYTAQGVSDMPFVSWRLVRTKHDALQVFFGSNTAARGYDPDRAFFISKPTESAMFLDGALYSFPLKSVASSVDAWPEFSKTMDSLFGEETMGKFAVVAAADSAHRIGLFVTDENFASPAVKANFGTHIFPSDTDPYEEELDARETGYTLVDVDEELFVNVYRGSSDAKQQWGHTYVSGLSGRHFSLSLPYNRRLDRATAAVDFHRVAGLTGTIVANVVLNSRDERCRQCQAAACSEYCEYGTVFSRDNGKSWQRIAPPEDGDCEGNVKSCNLHLHSYSSASAFNTHPIVSSKSAPGLVMATGNEGAFLDLRSDTVANANVYMSRDAGESWNKLATGKFIYGQTDYGGLLFLIPSGRSARHVNVSIDEGASWTSFPVAPDDVSYVFSSIINSVSLPSARFINVLAFPGRGGRDDVAMWIDLSGLKDRTCVGMNDINAPTSDFEYFQPSSYFGESGFKCFMGHMASYARKRQGATCWVDVPSDDVGKAVPNYLLPKNVVPCNCTKEDYECDIGFIEDGDNCVPEASIVDVASTVEESSSAVDIPVQRTVSDTHCGSGQHVGVTTGYRKLGGDTCVGGLDLNPSAVTCPPSNSDHLIGIAALLVLMIAAVLLFVWQKAQSDFAFAANAFALCPPLKFLSRGPSPGDATARYSMANVGDDETDDEADEERALTTSHREGPPCRRQAAATAADEVAEELTNTNVDAFAVPVTVHPTTTPQPPRDPLKEDVSSPSTLVELSSMEPPPIPVTSESPPSKNQGNLDFLDFGQ